MNTSRQREGTCVTILPPSQWSIRFPSTFSIMSTMSRSLLLLALFAFATSAVASDRFPPNYRKVSVSYLFLQPNASAAPQLRQSAPRVTSYGTFDLFEIPKNSMDWFAARARQLGLRVEDRSSYDRVFLPRGNR